MKDKDTEQAWTGMMDFREALKTACEAIRQVTSCTSSKDEQLEMMGAYDAIFKYLEETHELKSSPSMQEVEKVQTLFKESVDKLLKMFERDVQTEHQQSEEYIKKEGHHMGTARWHRAYGQAMQDAWARTKSVLLGDHSGSIKPIEIIEDYQKSLAGKGE